jgi:heme-degrading monooxygenase HmoA
MHEGAVFTAAIWTVKPGREEEFARAWQEFADWTLDNQGAAVGGRLLRSLDERRVFLSVGPWKSLEAVADWRESDEFKAFFAGVSELCDDIRPLTLEPAGQATGTRPRPGRQAPKRGLRGRFGI